MRIQIVRRSSPYSSAAIVAYTAALLIVCLGAWQIWRGRYAAIRNTELDTRNLSRSLAQQATRSVETVDIVLSGLVERIEGGALRDPSQLKRILDWRRGMVPQVLSLVVLDADGNWILDSISTPHALVNTADRSYFTWHRDHADKDIHIDVPVVSRLSGATVIPLTRRWNRPDGSFGGIVFAAVKPDHFQNFYDKLGLGSDGAVTLFSASGRLLARQPAVEGTIGRDFSNLHLFRHMLPNAPSGSYTFASQIDGIERIVGYEHVDGYPLVVYVGRGLAEVLAPWRRSALVEGGILGLAAVGLVGVGIALSRNQRRAAVAEAAVGASEARYRLLAENSVDMITQMDLAGQRLFVSPGSRNLLGYEPNELVGTTPHEMIHPEDAAGVKSILGRLASGDFDQALNVNRLRHRDGHWVWVEASLKLLRGNEGQPTGYVALIRDITLRKRTEDALRDSEQRYRLLAENASELIMLAHDDGRRSYISQASERLLGFSPDELSAMHLRDYVHPEDLPALFASTRRLGERVPEVTCVYRALNKHLGWIWVEGIFRRIPYAQAGEPSIVATFRDVTEREDQARLLERAKAEAESGARVKAEFLANMSHELRTPLTGMLGVHDLLHSDPSLTDRQRHFVGLAQDSGHALLTIVNDILDFSKIEAGQMPIEQVPFRLRDLVESCRQLGKEAIRLRGVDLTSTIEADVPDLFLGDPTRLRQVLLNLTTNAIKFTTEGCIEVRVRRSKGGLRFSVSDTGIGISPEMIPHLFERFSQADGSTARRFGGTGLGLAICKRIVELMDGRIGVESTTGVGSTFWFEVPLRVAEGERSPELRRSVFPGASGPGRRILLAEDNPVNQEIIQCVLAPRGHKLTVVGNGAAAIEAFRHSTFDVVLMDVQMPGTDGLAATREIRRFERVEARSATPIVALTANAMAEEALQCREAGMDAHVAKPIDWKQLFATIDGLCGTSVSASASVWPEALVS